jgi:hypothetical protein
MKHLNKFDESIFSKKKDESEDLKPKGFKTVERPSEEQLKKGLEEPQKVEYRVDKYFIQEISDRLYGPDSEEYVKALKELNKKFTPRSGRFGSQFYEPGQNS